MYNLILYNANIQYFKVMVNIPKPKPAISWYKSHWLGFSKEATSKCWAVWMTCKTTSPSSSHFL